MARPCAVFWDIHNINVPKGRSVDFIVKQIRSTIIKAHNLNETFFFCVCDMHKLPSKVAHSLINLEVDIVQAYNGVKDSVYNKKTNLVRKFVELAGNDCTIILLSGSADYFDTLTDLKKLNNLSIYLVRLASSCSPKLDQISDYTYNIDNGVLKPVKSTGLPIYFISIMNYPLTKDLSQVMKGLNGQALGSIPNSAILHVNSIYIGFPTLWNAEKAIKLMHRSRYYGHFLKVGLVADSPLTEIIKCLKPNLIAQNKSNREVKQLTFIKINNSDGEIDIRRVTSFYVAGTAKSTSRCILAREPFLWIVFLFKSAAQKCLAKIKTIYPDAIISEPPDDLTLTDHENPYIVEPCEQKVTNQENSDSETDNCNRADSRSEEEVQSQNESSSSICHTEPSPRTKITLRATKKPAKPKLDPQNFVNLDVGCDNDWKLFFRLNHSLPPDLLYYQATKWSLLYNLFEQLYDLGVKKVMFDGLYYCAHFESVTQCLIAFSEMRSRYLDPLEFVLAQEEHKKEVTKKMNRYYEEIPWCLNEELDLHCLVLRMDSQFQENFIEISKNILGNHDCIFIKSSSGSVWFGFPDELVCKNSRKALGFLACLQPNDIFMTKPSDIILRGIDFSELVGDAYDLAFLSRQLKTSKPIAKPRIIERLSLRQMEEQEFYESVYHFSVRGYFVNRKSWAELSLQQIVKILVKFSKVIPLAATASYIEVNFMFSSWYEAHAARHFINKLTLVEVPYFEEIQEANEVKKEQFIWHEFSEFYIINDKRKILDKIVRSQNLMDGLDSNPSTVDSTSDFEVLEGEMMKKLEYFYTITTNPEFKFTSGMKSIIEMKLVRMNCPVFVEFEDKIWVGVEDSEKGNTGKAKVDQIKFKILHESDEDDFEVEVKMESVPSCPEIVAKMLANKFINLTKVLVKKTYLHSKAVPLGHFNYNYRKAVGMSIDQYCRLNETI